MRHDHTKYVLATYLLTGVRYGLIRRSFFPPNSQPLRRLDPDPHIPPSNPQYPHLDRPVKKERGIGLRDSRVRFNNDSVAGAAGKNEHGKLLSSA